MTAQAQARTTATDRSSDIDVLVLAQLPPPVHGVTATTDRVHRWLAKQPGTAVEHIWSGSAGSLTEVDSRTLGKFWSFAALNLRLGAWLISGRRFDVAYVTLAPWTHAALRDALAAWWGRRLAHRTLVHLHGEGLDVALRGSHRKARLMRWLLQGTELIAITGRAATIGEASGVFARVHTLANAAPDPSPAPESSPCAQSSERTLRIGFLGNLDPRKGVLDLVDCIEHLIAAGWSVEAAIAGGATPYLSEDALRQQLADRGLAGDIRVVGPVYGEDKDAFLRGLDIFLYLSAHDHAPLVLIEALSHGVVPLVRDTGGIAGIVGPAFSNNVIAHELTGPALLAEVERRLAPYRDGDRLAQGRRMARDRFLSTFTEASFEAGLSRILAPRTRALASSHADNRMGRQRIRSGIPDRIKMPASALVRSLHCHFATKPLPDRIGVYFHNLGPPERDALAACVETIRELGYRIVPMGRYLAAPAHEKVCSLSFDDNYASWHAALGLLDRLDVKATFYVNSLPFRDIASESEVRGYFQRIGFRGDDATLTRGELRDIAAAGHEIGGHSHSHYVLSTLSVGAWGPELRDARTRLQDIVTREVRHFAWPYGMPRHMTEAQKDFCLAAGYTSIAAATPGMLHQSPVDIRNLARTEWRSGKTAAENLVDMRIDGRLFTRLTGRSVIG